MHNFFNRITIIFFSCLVIINSPLSYAQKENHQALYKWQDSSGKWHYSKFPPASKKNTTGSQIEVAKDTGTIIFEKQQSDDEDQQQRLLEEQKLKQKQLHCRSTQATMRDTALHLRRLNDKDYQERTITLEEYSQQKISITKLEEIGTDVNFSDICMDDFSKAPQIKAISDCISDQDNMLDRTNCLKELPTINY